MAEFINTIDALGDDAVIDGIIMRTITEFKDDAVIEIGKYAFNSCKNLADLLLPNVSLLRNYSFENCISLKNVDLPELLTVQWEGRAFKGCTSLETMRVPKATYLEVEFVSGCSALREIYCPMLTSVRNNMFYGCSSLEVLDLPSLTEFLGIQPIGKCTKLKALVLRYTAKVCVLGSSSTMDNSTIKSGTGYVYVPSALVDSYKSATNWSAYASQIRALEDYTVDGTITGELDETKI